jgi:teichuronic acid biosynthesis glycosyltransferase TuaH
MANKILFASHTAAGGVFKVGSHHLSKFLSLQGYEVAHVSTPYSRVQRYLRRGDSWLTDLALGDGWMDDAGVRHIQPYTSLPIKWTSHRMSLRRTLSDLDFLDPDFLILDEPLMAALSDVVINSKLVYRPTDLHPAGTARRREMAFVQRADGIVATSSVVMEGLGPFIGKQSMVLENGVDYEGFASVDGAAIELRGDFVYVGALDSRFDWAAVDALGRALPDARIDIYGPVVEQPPAMPDNVRICGSVPYSKLPSLLRGYRVGLLPLSDDPTNAGRSPMKLFEYIACCLPVVSRSTAPLRELGAEDAVFLYEDYRELVSVASAALGASPLGRDARCLAEKNSWKAKARLLTDFLEQI